MARRFKQALLEHAMLEHVDFEDDRSSTSSIAEALADRFLAGDVKRCVYRSVPR